MAYDNFNPMLQQARKYSILSCCLKGTKTSLTTSEARSQSSVLGASCRLAQISQLRVPIWCSASLVCCFQRTRLFICINEKPLNSDTKVLNILHSVQISVKTPCRIFDWPTSSSDLHSIGLLRLGIDVEQN
jgi:hypothetical protein